MKNSQLNRVLSLMKKTGDRVIVLDQASDDVVVLLPLNDYEHIVTESPHHGPDDEDFYTDDDMFSLDDQDDSNTEEAAEHFSSSSIEGFPPDEVSVEDIPVENYFSDTESVPAQKSGGNTAQTLDFTSDWADSDTKAPASEENLSDIPSDDEDPPFYLEPVE